MRIEILGGGNEVGASCVLCQLGDANILVDAGIRMGSGTGTGLPADSLPDLSRLSDLGQLDAVLVTHAHLDHTGALPLVHQAFPETPIYATAPTARLAQVLLADALRIMGIKAEQEAEIPLYNAVMVERMFTRVVPITFGTGPVPVASGIEAEFFPAGHILGAASVVIRAEEGTLLVTGDFSRSDQRTVAGMTLPPCRPDVLITESTYGNRLHANREAEETRLVETITAAIERGGTVLIPAFALGRAQEVLLILQDFQRRGLLPTVPIWVDGMVRSICEVYSDFPAYLMPYLRRRIEQNGNPFYRANGQIRPVTRSTQREEILRSGPSIIVASSGMLSGGPSQFYAFNLARDPRSAILLTGYQDEESPGRKILAIAEQGGGYLSYEGESAEINCEINKYGLSAHADAAEIAALVQATQAKNILLVHGDDEARVQLENLLQGLPVSLPNNGEAFTYDGKTASRRASAKASDPAGKSPSKGSCLPGIPPDLEQLWEKVARGSRRQRISSRAYSPAELAKLGWGLYCPPNLIEELAEKLQQENPYFVPDRKRPYLYRAKPAAQVAVDKERQQLMQQLKEWLPGKLIVLSAGDEIVPGICFSCGEMGFQAVRVGESETDYVPDDLLAVVGDWQVEEPFDPGREKTRLHRVQLKAETLTRAIPPILLGEVLSGKQGELMELSLEEICSQLRCRTDRPALTAVDEPLILHLAAAWQLARHRDLFSCRIENGITFCRLSGPEVTNELIRNAHAESKAKANPEAGPQTAEPLEMNQALAAVDQLLPPETGLYRKGADISSRTLLLYFNFPAAATTRYRREIDELSALTGWQIKVNKNPNGEALRRLALSLLPREAKVRKGPSLRLPQRQVEIKLAGKLETACGSTDDNTDGRSNPYEEAVRRFAAETGLQLVLTFEEGKSISFTGDRPQAGANEINEKIENESGLILPPEEAESPPMEINAAYRFIRTCFDALEVEVCKTGKKVDPVSGLEYIEISFISPRVGEQHRKTLVDIARETGWPVAICPNPNQHAIMDFILRVVPGHWEPAPTASFYPEKGLWAIRVGSLPEDEAELRKIQELFRDYCGYELQFTVRKG